MHFQGYFDDSGSDLQSPIYVVAGLIAAPEVWANFESDWQGVLLESPAISNLHMADANALKGEFANISQEKKDQKLLALAKLFSKHALKRIDTSMRRVDFNEFINKTVPDKNFNDPYFLCFYKIITSLVREPSHSGFNFELFFDDQGQVGQLAVNAWDSLISDYPREFATTARPQFCSDKICVPLQAADMYAWHVRKSLVGKFKGRQVNPHHHIDEIFDQLPYLPLPIHRDELVRHAAGLTLTHVQEITLSNN